MQITKTLAAAVALSAGLAVGFPAQADMGGGGGGGGDGGISGGDFAIRAELQNPQFVEPGSPYGYYRSYSRPPEFGYPAPQAAPGHLRGYGQPYRYEYRGR